LASATISFFTLRIGLAAYVSRVSSMPVTALRRFSM
jgi:hypothetical protein